MITTQKTAKNLINKNNNLFQRAALELSYGTKR